MKPVDQIVTPFGQRLRVGQRVQYSDMMGIYKARIIAAYADAGMFSDDPRYRLVLWTRDGRRHELRDDRVYNVREPRSFRSAFRRYLRDCLICANNRRAALGEALA